MKKTICILVLLLGSQLLYPQANKTYTEMWASVQKLESEDLTRSALKVVNLIAAKAKAEQNQPEGVKALLFTSKYALILEEDARLQIITDFREAISRAETPTKNILESYLANLYWQYFQLNRYQFYERTPTTQKVDSTDFRTWDLTTLFYEVNTLFERSLQPVKDLQKVETSAFEAILVPSRDRGKYRPTLFDLLAHTALDFYMSGENSITRPADKFEITDPDLLCEALQFTELVIPLADDTSLQARALRLYQELIRFHLKDPDPAVLVDTDIARLNFTYQNAVFEAREKVYESVLNSSASRYAGQAVSTLYSYEIAFHLNRLAEDYQPGLKEENRWKRREALEICEQSIKAFPKSPGAQKCRALQSILTEPDMQLEVENHIPVARPSKLLIHHRNLDGLSLKAYVIAQDQFKVLNDTYPVDKQLSFIKGLKLVEEWQTDLRNEMDYQLHSTEVLIPPLANGMYVILATPHGGRKIAFGYTQVTDMALIQLATEETHAFQVVNRMKGQPLPGVNFVLSYQENHDGVLKERTYSTDSNGMVAIPLTQKWLTTVTAKLTNGKDKAWFGEYYIGQEPEIRQATDAGFTIYLFTDRGIYRPGQPMYIKGIALSGTAGSQTVKSGTPVSIGLRDVNGQTVAEREFMTNDFGSFSGEFMIPTGGLTGIFTLTSQSGDIGLKGNTDISVEEYKRPRFQAILKPVTEIYKVNDTVRIQGSASTYAGSAVSNARVSYRVQRVVNFPIWYYWSRPYFRSNPQEIAFGETQTDTYGNYEIPFRAIPDNSVPQADQPVFTYEVSTEVTDINGETQTADAAVNVGYHALTAQITIPQKLDKEQAGHKISLTTANLNGQPVAAKGTLRIYKLQAPEFVLRKRPWPAPDYKNLNRDEFKALFPYEAFTKEDDPLHWQKGSVVWERGFDTGKTSEIALGNIKKWESGAYLLEIQTTDRFGQVVTAQARTILYSKNDPLPADNSLFEIQAGKEAYEPGETAEITVGSNMDTLNVTVYIEKGGKIVGQQQVELRKNNQVIRVPVTVADRGGFALTYSYSAYNSFYSGSLILAVPYPDSGLEIETVTFRDKLEPGMEETWSFRIKGPAGERVAAEMLAGMYDASLDSFREHSWSFDPLAGPIYYNQLRISGQQSYGTNYFNTNGGGSPVDFPVVTYDAFNWFGLTFGFGREMAYRKNAYGNVLTGAVRGVAVNEMEVADEEMAGEEALNEVIDMDEQDEPGDSDGKSKTVDVQIRRNLQETAFFYPQLATDKEGNISFSFTTPEALTRWKVQLLAHTPDLRSKIRSMEAVTQKEVMVIPNYPRFLREGDEISLSTKIANMSGKPLEGEAYLELADAITGNDITGSLLPDNLANGANSGMHFKVEASGNTQVSWQLKIPSGLQAVQLKVIAKAGSFSDGEQQVLPVLTNRMLITEALPLWVGSDQSKSFTLEKLRDHTSTSLTNHKLTMEITSNPAWYAVQALPYLMEYPFDCNEQVFARYYANTLASHIANSNPKIREVFEQWAGSGAAISNLEKNEELKSLMIQETPWLRDAQSETEQKKRIGLLFDLNKMDAEQANALQKLKNSQLPSGAWPWFNGGGQNRYITQHILTGIGYLQRLHALQGPQDNQMISRAMEYLDAQFITEFEEVKKHTAIFGG